MNEDISPVEAGLKWTIGQRRRDACDFLGGEVSPRPHGCRQQVQLVCHRLSMLHVTAVLPLPDVPCSCVVFLVFNSTTVHR